jgi:hypothetical protein
MHGQQRDKVIPMRMPRAIGRPGLFHDGITIVSAVGVGDKPCGRWGCRDGIGISS